MDGRRNGTRRTDRRPAPGTRPRWKAFIPYIVLGAVMVAAFIWIYFIGPFGNYREPVQAETEATERDLGARPDPIELARRVV
jgi:hypothetical protein